MQSRTMRQFSIVQVIALFVAVAHAVTASASAAQSIEAKGKHESAFAAHPVRTLADLPAVPLDTDLDGCGGLKSAHDQAPDVRAAFAAGVGDFLSKPADNAQLAARMRCGERVLELERRGAERIAELEKALEEVRALRHLLPICMYCKKVRDDADYWHEIEAYIHAQTGTEFSRGICPGCMETVVRPQMGQLPDAATTGKNG